MYGKSPTLPRAKNHEWEIKITILTTKLLITIHTLRFLLNSMKKKTEIIGTVLSVKMFLTKYNIPVLHHPPYLTPCDFYLCPKIKSALKEHNISNR